MRRARVFVNAVFAGILEELDNHTYRFTYDTHYQGLPVSLTMPTQQVIYDFEKFPAFFEGLLPEGSLLESILRKYKLDRDDYFGLLLVVGADVVGATTIEEIV